MRAAAGPRIYFRVVHANPAQQKRLPLPFAAARLRKDHLTICILDAQGQVEGAKLDLGGAVGAALHDRIATLTCLHRDPRLLRSSLLEHVDDKALEYTFDVPIAGFDVGTMQPIMDKLFVSLVCSLQTKATSQGPKVAKAFPSGLVPRFAGCNPTRLNHVSGRSLRRHCGPNRGGGRVLVGVLGGFFSRGIHGPGSPREHPFV